MINLSRDLLQQPGGNRGEAWAIRCSLIVGEAATGFDDEAPLRWPVDDLTSASIGIASEHLVAMEARPGHEWDMLIAVAVRRLDVVVRRLTDLSWAGFDVLRVTCAHGHIGVRELTRRAGAPGQPFGPAVDVLVARQLATAVSEPRCPAPTLRATAAGCALVRRVGPAIALEERRILHQIAAVRSVTDGSPL